jgi:hypothetical protein
MTSRGGTRAEDVVPSALPSARATRDGVRDRFGITLVSETVPVRVALGTAWIRRCLMYAMHLVRIQCLVRSPKSRGPEWHAAGTPRLG